MAAKAYHFFRYVLPKEIEGSMSSFILFYIFFSIPISYLYASVYFPFRLLFIGEVKSLIVKEVIYIPEITTRSGDIPAYYEIKFNEINFSVETSESVGEDLEVGKPQYVLLNEKVSYGLLLSKNKASFNSILFNGYLGHIWLIIVCFALLIVQLYMGGIMFWNAIRDKIIRLFSDSDENGKFFKQLTIAKGVLSYAPILSVLMILPIILTKAVFTIEHIGQTATGFIIHLSSVVFAWSPYYVIKGKDFFETNKYGRMFFATLKIIISIYALLKLVSFLYSKDFSLYSDLKEMLGSLIEYLVD